MKFTDNNINGVMTVTDDAYILSACRLAGIDVSEIEKRVEENLSTVRADDKSKSGIGIMDMSDQNPGWALIRWCGYKSNSDNGWALMIAMPSIAGSRETLKRILSTMKAYAAASLEAK